MLKKFLSLFLVLSLIFCNLCMTSVFASSVSITDKTLESAFQKLVSSESNDKNYKVKVEDKNIYVSSDDGDYTIAYDLTNNPMFSYTLDVEKGMDYNTFKQGTDNLSSLMIAYMAIANLHGIDFEDSGLYFSMCILTAAFSQISSENIKNSYTIVPDGTSVTGDLIVIKESEFGNRVMEYVNAVYEEKTSIKDTEGGINSFEWTTERKDVTSNSCKLVSTLKINLEADFSQLKGYKDKLEDSFMGNDNEDESEQSKPANNTFPDVIGTKYEDAVKNLVELGIINGFEDNTFRPTNNVTRAQFAKMLVEALQLNSNSSSTSTSFSDVTDAHWAHNYIKIAVENSVINGYPDGTFKPDKSVTYVESMAMILRAMGLESKMSDKSWPLGYINEARQIGLLDDVDYTEPNVPANRGETAISLFNMLNKMEGTETKLEENQNISKAWSGKYINNIDGYMELSIETLDNNSFKFTFVGYKEGTTKAGCDIARVINGKGVYKDSFSNETSITFVREGTNINVISENEDNYIFAGSYKIDDGTINSIERTNPNTINATYTRDNLSVELEELTNGKMNFSLVGAIDGNFIGMGNTLDYSNGIASIEDTFFDDIEKISIIIEKDKIILEASSTDADSLYNKISGTYELKSNIVKTINDYKELIKDIEIEEGFFMY